MNKELLTAAKNAHATIASFYAWVDRVEKAGGLTCISGVAEAHAMMKSLKANKARLDTLVTDPLLLAIKETEEEKAQ